MSFDDHIRGPWMCFVDVDGHFSVLTHIETAIAINIRRWENEEDAIQDFYGYNQPNGLCDISESKIATARLVAAAPCLLKALGTLYAMTIWQKVEAGEPLTEDEEILRDDTMEVIAKAIGDFSHKKGCTP
jgi:hypothetical protein